METHVTRQPVLGELRRHVLALLLGHPLFSEAEQLRANHFVYESEDIARLTRWHANVLAEIARREAAAAHQRGQVTLQATLRRLRSGGFRGHRPRQPQPGHPGLPYPTALTATPAPSTAEPPPALLPGSR